MDNVIILDENRQIDLIHEHPECRLLQKWRVEQMEEKIKYLEED